MKVYLYLIFASMFLSLTAQDITPNDPALVLPVSAVGWSSEVVFKTSQTPWVRNITNEAATLSKQLGVMVMEHNKELYPIRTWADYFLWFTDRFWYRFEENVAIYKYFYLIGDDLGMASFISRNYKGGINPLFASEGYNDKMWARENATLQREKEHWEKLQDQRTEMHNSSLFNNFRPNFSLGNSSNYSGSANSNVVNPRMTNATSIAGTPQPATGVNKIISSNKTKE